VWLPPSALGFEDLYAKVIDANKLRV